MTIPVVPQTDVTSALWLKDRTRATKKQWLEMRLFLLKRGTTLPRWDLLRAEYQGFLPEFFDFRNGIAGVLSIKLIEFGLTSIPGLCALHFLIICVISSICSITMSSSCNNQNDLDVISL